MGKIGELLEGIPDNGVLSIIQRDVGSGGETFALMILKELLERGETVFLFLYEPLTVLEDNCRNIGLDIEKYLGKNLIIFDTFGSVYHLPQRHEGIHQLYGYLDDPVFIVKIREWGLQMLRSRDWKNLWIFTYTSTGVCKLFTRPYLTYKMIWSLRHFILKNVDNSRTVLTLSPIECPEVEELAYLASDIVVETIVRDGTRVGVVTKGQKEGDIFELFGGG